MFICVQRSTLIRWIVVLCVCIASVLSDGHVCRNQEDCDKTPEGGYFCSPLRCNPDNGRCEPGENGCPAACLEELRACVECLTNEDCDGTICDLKTHRCRPCASSADCGADDWCHGGPRLCIHGICTPNRAAFPCPQEELDTCMSHAKQCRPCARDAECEPPQISGGFCQHGQWACNVTDGICYQSEKPCRDRGLACNSKRQQCVECLSVSDCNKNPERPFCAPPLYCKAGTCVEDQWKTTPCDTEVGWTCDERRKTCVRGEGREVVPKATRLQAQAESGDLLNADCYNRESMCRHQGLVCRIVSATDDTQRQCRPCDTHAECTDGNPTNGDERCLDNGHCERPQEGQLFAKHYSQQSSGGSSGDDDKTDFHWPWGTLSGAGVPPFSDDIEMRAQDERDLAYTGLFTTLGLLSGVVAMLSAYYCIITGRCSGR